MTMVFRSILIVYARNFELEQWSNIIDLEKNLGEKLLITTDAFFRRAQGMADIGVIVTDDPNAMSLRGLSTKVINPTVKAFFEVLAGVFETDRDPYSMVEAFKTFFGLTFWGEIAAALTALAAELYTTERGDAC